MIFLCQWHNRHRKMAIGDTIVQQASIPPTKFFSREIIFGVRINGIIDRPGRKGALVTKLLKGMRKKGLSAFTVEQ
ncbi:MAG TPA: hypothetical protein VFL76_00640 [Edaphocola sp.]|nr:hypothetical protein [Edaphocola sp.]